MPGSKEHPSYPNPTISEALCEIHFRRAPHNEWRPSIPGDLFKIIQNEFPEMEPRAEVGIAFEVGPEAIGHRILRPVVQRMRFKHGERPILLQLIENTLTINELPKYPGWETMKKDVLSAWNNAEPVLQADRITRVGLRYINRIPRENADQIAGEWLKESAYIPSGVLTSRRGYLSRIEANLNEENRVAVTLGEHSPAKGEGHGDIILDIDRILYREIEPTTEALSKSIEKLHDDVWMIFEASKTEKLQKLLEVKK